jgi:Flp pilus assembly protein TadG
MPPLARPALRIIRFLRDEAGTATIMALFFVLISAVIGGLAIDFNKAMARRTHLQVTADAVAHAALYTRERNAPAVAIDKALEIAAVNLPPTRNGDALLPQDIEFGVWDDETRSFTPDPGARGAVRVSAHRIAERDNPVRNLLLRMVGFPTFDLSRAAVYVTYQPTCFREGFVANGVVDVQSNNAFQNGFCIHANDHVKVSSNNFFGDDTIVSMPNTDHLQLPRSGFDTNTGLEEALRDNGYHIRILNQLEGLVASLSTNSTDTRPDYITSGGTIQLDGKSVDGSEFQPGRAYVVTCTGGSAMQIKGAGTIRDVTVVTNCPIRFGQGTVLENVVMATTNTGSKSIASPSSLQIGRNDNCAPGGGAQILTLGGVDVAADLRMYGGQIIARGDVNFAANANGIAGASIIAGGDISGTSNMTMGFCGDGMENSFRAAYFRLVE